MAECLRNDLTVILGSEQQVYNFMVTSGDTTDNLNNLS